MTEFTVNKNSKLSKAVLENTFLKYGAFMTLLKRKDVKVNGKRVSKDVDVKSGDSVTVYSANDAPKEEYGVTVYEDDNILVVDKFKGVTSDKLYEYLKLKYDELYYVHRLDCNTDGIIVFAKNEEANAELLKGFKERTFKKYYYALCYGFFNEKSGVLEDFLLKDANSATVKIYSSPKPNASRVVTGYEEVSRGDKTSLLKVELFTGKTHQIRAHLAHYGHFIVGDYKYGDGEFNRKYDVKKQLLTSYKIVFSFDGGPLKYLDGKSVSVKRNIQPF